MREFLNRSNWLRGLLFLSIALVAITPAFAQVDVGADVTGDAVPGGVVTATATVDITDGSTIQSYAWTQTAGVPAVLSGDTTDTLTVTLGGFAAFKAQLVEVLLEPPIGEDQLPDNVPPPEGEFVGGMQNRFYIPGMNHWNLEEGGLVVLELDVTTTSGTYSAEIHIIADLGFNASSGIGNIAPGEMVLFQGKTQDSYDWLATGAGCGTLMDATTQNPYFDAMGSGACTVSVTDMTADPAANVDIIMHGDNWLGIITGQDGEGNPTWTASCSGCHNDGFAPDKFTPWAATGHAEIFSANLDTSDHYGTGCFDCHTIGYNTELDNNGMDDQADYEDFIASDLLPTVGDNWTTMLSDYPLSAQMANIQCESCHGPQGNFMASGHGADDGSRTTLSSDVCARCHGEPARHGRYQQWQLSGHANYELAIDESTSGSCSKCHTGNGFLAWLPALFDEDPSNDSDNVTVTWTADEAHPQTCQTCHEPHSIGDVSGDDNNATVRITGDTPLLGGGYVATDVGRGAICMTCHNTRRGLRNDDTFDTITDRDRAPHLGAQGDTIMGQNWYWVTPGSRGAHSMTDNVADTCATCHMESTPPPADLSYNQGGTNHTFFARIDICSECHGGISDGTAIQSEITGKLAALEVALVQAWEGIIDDQLAMGNSIGIGETVLTSYDEVELYETHGRMALAIFSGGEEYEAQLGSITSIPTMGDPTDLATLASDDLIKAYWNYFMAEDDESLGIHNYPVVSAGLNGALAAIGTANTDPCVADGETACLRSGRFEVTIDWQRTPEFPGSRPANVSDQGTDDTAFFYFVNSNNVEFLIKVLDACGINDAYWVSYAGTTDVEFSIDVRDTTTGATQSYDKAQGPLANAVIDSSAFATCP